MNKTSFDFRGVTLIDKTIEGDLAHIKKYFSYRKVSKKSLCVIEERGYPNFYIFHTAVFYGHANVVQYLIWKNREVVNFVDLDGSTGLHHAAATGRIRMAKMLMESGSDIRTLNQKKKTAADVANENGHYHLATILTSRWCGLEWFSKPPPHSNLIVNSV